ncbi:MAG: PAS domain-containing sensor histidine kinase [Usitatibacter sp.]
MSRSIPPAPGDPPQATGDNPELPPSRLVVFLGPVIAVGAFTATLAIVAAALGFHREEMLFAAAGIGCATVLPALFLLYRQVADRQATLRELQNVQARVGDIVESAMDAIITINEQQRVVKFNAAAERAFRWPRAAVVGQRLDMLIPERYRGAHLGHIERFGHTATTSRGMGAQTVLYGLRADGAEFPIEASISQHSEEGGKLFTVILRDVTERVRSEEMLARSETRLRGILDSAMDAIITVDERQHIVLFNKAAEAVFGCGRDEAIGAPLAWFIPDRFRGAHAEHLNRFAEGGTSSRRMGKQRTVMGLRRNGEEFPIDASISQITEQGRKLFTVILRDVTERTRQEEALRHSRDEIRALGLASNSLREQEKSRVARELHDELGQALTALKLDVGWLKARAGQADDEIRRKLDAMQVLLDGTVAATRRISTDLRPLVLDDLGLAAAADWLAQNFTDRTGIPCELAVGEGFEDVPDPHATTIFRVLQESLTNVAKHAQARNVEVTLTEETDRMILVVRDDGRGISPDGPRNPSSFGILGLRERAYLLGGEVSIKSSPGRGTIVEMRLPHPAPGANS